MVRWVISNRSIRISGSHKLLLLRLCLVRNLPLTRLAILISNPPPAQVLCLHFFMLLRDSVALIAPVQGVKRLARDHNFGFMSCLGSLFVDCKLAYGKTALEKKCNFIVLKMIRAIMELYLHLNKDSNAGKNS